MTDTAIPAERAVLVGVGEKYAAVKPGMPDRIEELRLLAETAGADVVAVLIQARDDISPRFYLGSGKAEELKCLVEDEAAQTVIFDNDLAPAQVRNLQNLLGEVKIIDRSGLILDIFAIRARTSESRIQVELAQLKHQLPRLTRQWSHLSRQVGGIGVRGPGETQLEVDRRRIRDRIGHLTEKLRQIERRGDLARKHRSRTFSAALVGYTNAGKSTLFNALSRADAAVEDQLFKTLDTTTRRIPGEAGPDIVISDTVGFIRDLPHELVASFRSTLADVRDADLLLHVIDATSPDWREQMDVVERVLGDIHAGGHDLIPVFNKTDRLDPDIAAGLTQRYPRAHLVSALTGTGVTALADAIRSASLAGTVRLTIDVDPANGDLLQQLYRHGTVLDTVPLKKKLRITCALPAGVAERLGLG